MQYTVTVITRNLNTEELRVVRDEHVTRECLPERLTMIAAGIELSVEELTFVGVIPEPITAAEILMKWSTSK